MYESMTVMYIVKYVCIEMFHKKSISGNCRGEFNYKLIRIRE